MLKPLYDDVTELIDHGGKELEEKARCVNQEQKEELHVLEANTIRNPSAMVISPLHTSPTDTTMMNSWRLHTLACPTSIRKLVIQVSHLSLTDDHAVTRVGTCHELIHQADILRTLQLDLQSLCAICESLLCFFSFKAFLVLLDLLFIAPLGSTTLL